MEEDPPKPADSFRLLTEAEYYRLSPDERSAYIRRVVANSTTAEPFKREPEAD